MTDIEPLQLGVVGSSPLGDFLLERLCLGSACQLIAFEPAETTPNGLVSSLRISSTTNWHRFLSESELEAVLFLEAPLRDFARLRTVLESGLPAGLLPPLAEPTVAKEDFFSYFSLADPLARQTFVLNPHESDDDFRAAREQVRAAALGPLLALKRLSWVGKLIAADSEPNDHWCSRLLWEDVDQLLCLTGELPLAVSALYYPPQGSGYVVLLQFPLGAVAQLERRRPSVVPLDVGWILNGHRAGYANFRRYLETEAGEIYDVPCEAPAIVGDPLFARIWNVLRTDAPDDSFQRALHVLAVLRAIHQSAETNTVVRLNPSP